MLRRKHKKMRNKRGGSDFFKKFGDGVNTIKTNVGEGVTKTQAGINLAKISANEVTNNYNAELNKAVALPGHFGGRRKTRRRKKRRKTRKKRAGRKSKKNKRRTRRRR